MSHSNLQPVGSTRSHLKTADGGANQGKFTRDDKADKAVKSGVGSELKSFEEQWELENDLSTGFGHFPWFKDLEEQTNSTLKLSSNSSQTAGEETANSGLNLTHQVKPQETRESQDISTPPPPTTTTKDEVNDEPIPTQKRSLLNKEDLGFVARTSALIGAGIGLFVGGVVTIILGIVISVGTLGIAPYLLTKNFPDWDRFIAAPAAFFGVIPGALAAIAVSPFVLIGRVIYNAAAPNES